ncbi:MAG: hypothetical protein HY958_09455 [Bacteroidia bacterium]|nr:hypothetical protein [Bacteroidia bacterium]
MKTLFYLLVVVLLVNTANAQNGLFQTHDSLDLNKVKAWYWNNNNAFWDLQGNAKYEVPKGSGKTSVFSHSLWIGGTDNNGQLHLGAHRYMESGQDFYPGPLKITDGSTDTATSLLYNKIWKIKKTEIEEFIYRYQNGLLNQNYSIPDAIVNWPAHGPTSEYDEYLAPFFDNNSDGFYNPNDGDYPIIKGDQMLWYVFNDNTKPHGETGGTPLKVEVRVSAFNYNCNNPSNDSIDAINYLTFLSYKIINRSAKTYSNTFVGLFTDADIGYGYDDYTGFDLMRNMYFFYNGMSIDGTGQPEAYGGPSPPPPALGVMLLSGPYQDPNGLDDLTNWNSSSSLDCSGGYRIDSISGNYTYVNSGDFLNGNINGFNFGDNIVDNEKWGYTRFMAFIMVVAQICVILPHPYNIFNI